CAALRRPLAGFVCGFDSVIDSLGTSPRLLLAVFYFARINRRSPSAIIRNAKAAIQIATKRQRRWLGLVPDTTTSSWADTKVKIDFLKDLQSNKYGSPATKK